MNYIYPLSRYIKITQVYKPSHLGVDFGWNDGAYNHQPIISIEDGIVVGCADGYDCTYPNQRIYGNYVNIDHGNGWYSIYGHLLKGSVRVKKGQRVSKGDIIGQMGNSGYSYEGWQHLHFELRKPKNEKSCSIDPIPYLYVEDKSIYVNPASLEYDQIKYRDTSPVTPVERNVLVDQIQVDLMFLNCRNKPTLKGERLGFLDEGYYNVSEMTEADGYVWYRIGLDKWCAGVDKVTFYKGSATTLYKVLFPYVSQGDRNKLIQVAEEGQLRIIIEEL
jgi:hypothetical protein